MTRNGKKRVNVVANKSKVSLKKKKADEGQEVRAKINNEAIEKRLGLKMNKLTEFSIEDLHYGLMLDIIDLLEPTDVVELYNVSQGFRASVSKDPWRIVGRDVHIIEQSSIFYFHKFVTSSSVFQSAYRHLCSVASRINFCHWLLMEDLLIDRNWYEPIKQFLSSLRTVNCISLCGGHLHLFSDFTANVIESANIHLAGQVNKRVESSLVTFVETSLMECKKVWIASVSPKTFAIVERSLRKARAEYVHIGNSNGFTEHVHSNDAQELMQRIFLEGIPSQHPEGLFHFESRLEFTDYNGLLGHFSDSLNPRRAEQNEYQGLICVLKQSVAECGEEWWSFENPHSFVKDVDDHKLFYLTISFNDKFHFFAGHLSGS